MSLAQLKTLLDGALASLPSDNTAFMVNQDFKQETLKQIYRDDNTFTSLKDMLYGDNVSGWIPRLRKSFEFSIGQIDAIMKQSETPLSEHASQLTRTSTGCL
jgi:hypothetical protein